MGRCRDAMPFSLGYSLTIVSMSRRIIRCCLLFDLDPSLNFKRRQGKGVHFLMLSVWLLCGGWSMWTGTGDRNLGTWPVPEGVNAGWCPKKHRLETLGSLWQWLPYNGAQRFEFSDHMNLSPMCVMMELFQNVLLRFACPYRSGRSSCQCQKG